MAYLTCPWCLAPQMVGDDAPGYRCLSCYAEIRFFECPMCHLVQTVNQRWTVFSCGGCGDKVDLPRRWGFMPGAKAGLVRGAGQAWP